VAAGGAGTPSSCSATAAPPLESLLQLLLSNACAAAPQFQLPAATLGTFVSAVKDHYVAANPYHNFHHAVSVMHLVYMVMHDEPAATEHLTPVHRLAALLASLCHDVGHRGKNNAFESEVESDLALNYNDVSFPRAAVPHSLPPGRSPSLACATCGVRLLARACSLPPPQPLSITPTSPASLTRSRLLTYSHLSPTTSAHPPPRPSPFLPPRTNDSAARPLTRPPSRRCRCWRITTARLPSACSSATAATSCR
jgi:hypothetical protein